MGAPAKGWVIERGEDGWPSAMEELARPPERLFGLGDPAVLLGPCVSIVGARRATPYGLAIAEMASRISVECGITVVSGGAMGCDHAVSSAASRQAVRRSWCRAAGQTSYIRARRAMSMRAPSRAGER